MKKYKVKNSKPYVVSVLRFDISPGETEIKCSKQEADILRSSNDLSVVQVRQRKKKKKRGKK